MRGNEEGKIKKKESKRKLERIVWKKKGGKWARMIKQKKKKQTLRNFAQWTKNSKWSWSLALKVTTAKMTMILVTVNF